VLIGVSSRKGFGGVVSEVEGGCGGVRLVKVVKGVFWRPDSSISVFAQHMLFSPLCYAVD
jgi:hypothetical protein